MALTDAQRAALAAAASSEGVDPGELIATAEKMTSTPSQGVAPVDGQHTGESGTRAHGGKGYFAYEYPFLRTNEVRASLFLDPVADGDMFTGEWLAKHGGPASGSSGTPPADQGQQ